MDISRLKKVFAGVSASAIMLSQVATALAAYSDVPAGVWYEEAVNAFVDAGYLDGTQTRFRGTDNANRAEFVKLVVELNGGVINSTPATPSFDDVATGAWYYKYFEESGTEGWLRGDNSCYGKHPCFARPSANINRAEAAAIIVRAFGLEASGSAPQFVDNASGQWYTSDIQTAADHCVLQGDDSTARVRPSDSMNRAEMVVMLHRVDQGMTYGQDCGSTVISTPMVKDAVATSPTVIEVQFNVAVDETAAKDKTRYTVTGAPELPIDSITMTSDNIVELTLGTAMDASKTYTLTVVDMMTVAGAKFSDSVTFAGYTSVVQGDGTLEATLSAKNPVGDTVPQGAQGVVFTSIDLAASADDVVIENLTVLHEGFGDSADFTGVYALVDGARVTRKRTIDTQSYTATIRFTTPLVVRAGKTVTLQIAGDLATPATTSSEHALTVELPTDIVSNAKSVKGNFPLKGKSFRIAAVTSGVVSVTYRSVTPSNLKVGEKAVTVGKWEVAINSAEDQTFYSMTVQNDGTAGDGDFTNIAIKRSDGTILTKTVASTIGDYATLVFDPPFTVLEGDRITMNVIADIVGGAAKNIKINFDETGDIFAVGSLYGYGVNGQLYGSSITLGTSPAASTVTIDAGQFTISIDGPVTQQYTRKDKNVVLANIMFETGGEDVNVESIYMLIQGTTSTGAAFTGGVYGGRASPTAADSIAEALENVELRNTTTGRTISGVRLTTSGSSGSAGGTATGTYQVYRFDDFIVKGKEKYEFRVNFIDNSGTSTLAAPANGDKFRVHICGEATQKIVSDALVTNTTGCTLGGFFATSVLTYQMDITGVSTNDNVGDYRPGGTISGNFQEIKSAGLTISGKATATTDTAVKNAKNVTLLRFEARASEAADVLITNLTFESVVATTNALQNASNYAVWVDTNDDGVVDTILEKGVSTQSSAISFSKFTGGGYIVPKQKSVVFEVHADIASSLTTTNPQLRIQFDTGATFIQAEQVNDGTSLSGIGVRKADGTYETDSPFDASPNGSATSEVQVTMADATLYTIRSQGDLYVSASSTPVRTRQLLGGTLADEIMRLEFHAEYEDIDVTDLVFTASGANAASQASNVDRLELYVVGSTTAFATATVGGCGTDTVPAYSVCASMDNQQFVVPKGSNTNIVVRPRMRTDTDGATSNHVVKYFINQIAPSSNTNSGSVRARGLLSSNNLTGMDTDGTPEGEVYVGTSSPSATASAKVTSSENNVVLSKVTSITNADPNANGTAIPTGTAREVGQFKFAAAAANNDKDGANKWTLSGVIFTVNATNVDINSDTFKLHNKAAPTQKRRCSVDQTSGSSSLLVTCQKLPTASGTTVINTEITPGTDATFVLTADVQNGKVSNGSTSTLQTTLNTFDTQSATAFGTSASHLAWMDKDNVNSTKFYWIEYPDTNINGTSYNG